MSTKERIRKFSKKTLDKCIPYIKLKEYTESFQINPEEAKDYLIYGIQAEKLENGKRIDVVLFYADFNQSDLVILDKISNKNETLDLKMLMDVSFNFRENKYRNYFKISNPNSNLNSEINNNYNKPKRFSCFGNGNSKNNNANKNKNNNNNNNHVINNVNAKKKSKNISCLGGNKNSKKPQNNKDSNNIKNNNNYINNINNTLNQNNSIVLNSSTENNKYLSHLNFNSSNTQNTVPDNNTNQNPNNNNNNNPNYEPKGINAQDTSELASAAKRFISLVKSVSEKINLLFKSEFELKLFTVALFQIYQSEHSESDEKPNLNVFEKHLRKIWNKFDLNQTDFLEFPDFHRMIKLMDQNYNCIFNVNLKDEKAIKELSENLDKENTGRVGFDEFFRFYNEIIAGSEFEEVFLNYSKGKQHFNFEDLSEFIITEQKQFMKSDEIAEIFLQYKIEVPETPRNPEPHQITKAYNAINKQKFYNDRSNMSSEKDLFESGVIKSKIRNIDYRLNLMEFKNFISDKRRCCIFNSEAFEVMHDMSRPLNDYFIFSSHNTFLNKNIYGEGSLEMYNYAINEGCRMLELECYDGETEPKISQGSPINEVLLKDALLNLRENSFKKSNFPVLISLENYCKKEQQMILAQYLKDILKDIFTINTNKLPDKYPSPKDLEGKFIIKEIKTLEILRKSSLPMGNTWNMIKKTDIEYDLNCENIDNNSKDNLNSFSGQNNANYNKNVDEELMHFLNFYNLDVANRHEDLFDYEGFEDIPEENIHRPSLQKSFSILDRKAERIEDQFKPENALKKINTYGHIVINEWIEKSKINTSSSAINATNTGASPLNTSNALSKSNSMTLYNKSTKPDLNMNINILNSGSNTNNKNNNSNNNSNKNNFFIDESNEEDDRLLSANRANNAQRKKLATSFLSEIKEKEDDYESSYKKHCRSRDSDGLTLNRINSKFSDSNVYNNKNNNSDSSNRLNSLLYFSIDKHMDLSSQNRSSNNRSSKKQVNGVNYLIGNQPSNGQNAINLTGNFANNNNNNNTILSANMTNTITNTITNTNNTNTILNNSIANSNFFQGSNIIINNHNVNINLNTSLTNNHNNNMTNTNISNTAGITLISHNTGGKALSTLRSNISLNHSKTFANERQQQMQRQKIHDFSNTIKEMQDLAGLVKKKFYLAKLDDELFYNPWDCPAIRESELQEIFKNFHLRHKLVKYCKNSFLKVQPNKTSKISTINFDPVKAWICGIQIAAINIQSLEDDFVLINKIFFRFNKGSGYVLKPEFLRNPNAPYDRYYLKPLMRLKIDIISCLLLQTCVRNFNKYENIFFESYLVGSWEDDKMNPKYKSKSYEKNLINLVFDNESIKFDVYEPELCFWIIKIYLSNTVIARSCVPISVMNEGIRVVPLFDLNCNEFPDCVLLARIVKKNIAD